MKLNISENKILELFLSNQITLENIESSDREIFINNNGIKLLNEAFKNKSYNQLEILLKNQQVKDIFIKEIKSFNNLSELNFISKLPENNIVSMFILEMTRENFEYKKDFFTQMIPIFLENKETMKSFFAIKTGETLASFPKGQPIGLLILRVINSNIEELISESIIPMSLYNNMSKDTIAHCLFQYSFENNKVIVEHFSDLDLALKDKNELGHNALDKLSADLRERNVKTIEYLFTEKLDLELYKNEFMNYIIKSSNILKNKNTKNALRERAFSSLKNLFNLPQLQSNETFKELIAQNLAQKCSPDVQYLWLSAKLPTKGQDIKRPKI